MVAWTDGQGSNGELQDTIAIMTSNAGTGARRLMCGFGAARSCRTNSILGELGELCL